MCGAEGRDITSKSYSVACDLLFLLQPVSCFMNTRACVLWRSVGHELYKEKEWLMFEGTRGKKMRKEREKNRGEERKIGGEGEKVARGGGVAVACRHLDRSFAITVASPRWWVRH